MQYTDQHLQDAFQSGYVQGNSDAHRQCEHCRRLRIVWLFFWLGLVLWLMISTASQAIAGSQCDLRPDGAAILVGSKHVNASMDFQESNPGVFLAFDCGNVTTRVGNYRNSLDARSWAITWQTDHLAINWQGINATVFAGVAGYGNAPEVDAIEFGSSGVIPIGGFEFTHDSLPLFLQWTPMPASDDIAFDHLVAFGLQWNLN